MSTSSWVMCSVYSREASYPNKPTSPGVMLGISLATGQSINRWANIIVAMGFFAFNLLVSMVFKAVTIWYAWNWDQEQ